MTSDRTGLRILVVDDDALDRQAQIRELGKLDRPAAIVEAASLGEARQKLCHGAFDVAIVDCYLGDGNGLDLLGSLGPTPMVLVTGQDSRQTAVDALRQGAHGYLVKEVDGRHLALLVLTVENVLARQQVAKELQRTQDRLRTTLSTMSDVIFAFDREGVFSEYHQPADRPELMMSPEQFLGKPFREVLPPHVADLLAGAMAEIEATGERQQFEYPLEVHGGRQAWFTARVAGRRPDDELEGFTVVVQEITERKIAELRLHESRDELRRLVAELEAANAELERFVYTVSHDLKSPLLTIRGFLGMLRKDLAESRPEQVESDIQTVDQAAEKMGQLLSDLLDLSRVGRVIGEPQAVPLEEMVTETLDRVAGLLREHQVEVDVDAHLPVLVVDRQRFVDVLQNLCENAARFMGGQPRPCIRISAVEEEQRTLVTVADNGIGIDPAHHEKVFGLFERLHVVEASGTGVGLALVKRIVEAHEGRIWIESQGRGRGGSRFVVELPRPAGC